MAAGSKPISHATCYAPDSLHRPPEWRWALARWLVRSHQVIVRESDVSVRAAACFFKELSACQDELDHRRLARARPVPHAAWSAYVDEEFLRSPAGGLHLRMPGRPLRLQAALEGYLLAGLRHDEVARRLAMTPEAVGLYESWFFDFRDRLDAPAWIATYILRGDLADRAENDLETQLRLFGWQYGAQAVDELVRGTGYSTELVEQLKHDGYGHLVRRAAIMARSVHQPTALLEASARAQEHRDNHQRLLAAATDAPTDAREASHIDQVFAKMKQGPWGALDRPVPQTPDEKEALRVERRLADAAGVTGDTPPEQPFPAPT